MCLCVCPVQPVYVRTHHLIHYTVHSTHTHLNSVERMRRQRERESYIQSDAFALFFVFHRRHLTMAATTAAATAASLFLFFIGSSVFPWHNLSIYFAQTILINSRSFISLACAYTMHLSSKRHEHWKDDAMRLICRAKAIVDAKKNNDNNNKKFNNPHVQSSTTHHHHQHYHFRPKSKIIQLHVCNVFAAVQNTKVMCDAPRQWIFTSTTTVHTRATSEQRRRRRLVCSGMNKWWR